jgi:hypothetical protein
MMAEALDEERLEPLDRSKGHTGISTALRTVFEVLYEAGEPLDFETIAARTESRVPSAVRFHARRAWLRQLEGARRGMRRRRDLVRFETTTLKPNKDLSVEQAWRPWLTSLVRQAVKRGVLLRDGSTYRPNPDRAPTIVDGDGRRRRFTREQWQVLTAEERSAGELAILPMHLRGVVPDDPTALDDLIAVVARFWAKQPVRIDRRLRQVLELASTDEARLWFINELAHRRYAKRVPREE